MSRAEKFIEQNTRNYSNEILRNKNESFTNVPCKGEYNPWLTPDDARNAVKIAREEMEIKSAKWLKDNIDGFFSDKNRFIREYKQAMKDE